MFMPGRLGDVEDGHIHVPGAKACCSSVSFRIGFRVPTPSRQPHAGIYPTLREPEVFHLHVGSLNQYLDYVELKPLGCF